MGTSPAMLHLVRPILLVSDQYMCLNGTESLNIGVPWYSIQGGTLYTGSYYRVLDTGSWYPGPGYGSFRPVLACFMARSLMTIGSRTPVTRTLEPTPPVPRNYAYP